MTGPFWSASPHHRPGRRIAPGTVTATLPLRIGICKIPVAAGQGSGGFDFDIEPGMPDRSILTFRMESIEPAIAMPELGRQTVHEEALEVIGEWVASLPGSCE